MPSSEEEPLSPEVIAARHDVAVAKLELENRIEDVRRSSEKALAKLARKARPVLIGAAAVAAVVIVVRLARSASARRRARRGGWAASEPPSLVRVALGEALRAGVRMLAARVAENAVLRLAANEEPSASDDDAPLSAEPVNTAAAR